MDDLTGTFIKRAFGPDCLNEPEDLKESIRNSFHLRGPFARSYELQRDGLAEVIRTRGMSLTEWEMLTQGVVEFPGEDELYAYLQHAHAYFFGDAETPPPLPAQE
ncbi:MULTISPECIES: hypothetical protein [unclassified Streptomyces]|uniref:hypothetical protein n=1 Tax=unclassified Streptomyces TaxID=2593676 RepID=UPI002884E18E|nr:hypothetical protein [Streptomyces sp. DSM 41633]